MSKKKSNMIIKYDIKEEDREKETAKLITTPRVLAASTIKGGYLNKDDVSIDEIVVELNKQVKAVNNGDMKRVEEMLVSHAHSLDTLFVEMVSRSRANMGEYLDASIKYMGVALKIQNQCRMTLGTLSEIKNPKPYIQNYKAQYQQVNNGKVDDNQSNPTAHAYDAEKPKSSNELLEDNSHGQQWMDTGTPQEAVTDDKAMEAVEK